MKTRELLLILKFVFASSESMQLIEAWYFFLPRIIYEWLQFKFLFKNSLNDINFCKCLLY
jgi:hypothetical protein